MSESSAVGSTIFTDFTVLRGIEISKFSACGRFVMYGRLTQLRTSSASTAGNVCA